MERLRSKTKYLLLLFASFFTGEASGAPAPEAGAAAVWIDSLMLRHILRWQTNSSTAKLYTVQWKHMNEGRWNSVANCTKVAASSCDLSTDLRLSTLTYNIRLLEGDSVVGSLVFCPEFGTTLLPPEFAAKRTGNDVFVRPTTPRNLGTGNPLSDQLMTVTYQIKYWREEMPDNFTIFEASFDQTEIHFKVAWPESYCVTMRLYDQQYTAYNATSAQSIWGKVECLNATPQTKNDLSHMVVIAVILSTLLLVSLTAYGSYRIWKMRKKSRNRDKTFIQMLDKIFTLKHDNELQNEIELRENVELRLNLSSSSSLSLHSESHPPYVTWSSLTNREGNPLYNAASRPNPHGGHVGRRDRMESRGYHSASSQCTRSCDCERTYDGSEYLPADAVFSIATSSYNFQDRSFSLGDVSASSLAASGATEGDRRAPAYVVSEGPDLGQWPRSHDGGSWEADGLRFGEFTGLNPNYSSDNNRSIPDLLLLAANGRV